MAISTGFRCFIFSVCAAVVLSAEPTPTFDVASVRPRAASLEPHGGPENIEPAPTGIILRNVRMKTCIQWAFNVKPYQINGPGWIDSERFDITAKTGAPVPESDLRRMLQALLAERFKLALHRQNKDMPVLVLLVGKNGHKLKESEAEGPPNMSHAKMGMLARRMTMGRLAEILSAGVLQMPVIDMTELTGRYDFDLDMSPYVPADQPVMGLGNMPSVFATMLPEQLGLRQ